MGYGGTVPFCVPCFFFSFDFWPLDCYRMFLPRKSPQMCSLWRCCSPCSVDVWRMGRSRLVGFTASSRTVEKLYASLRWDGWWKIIRIEMCFIGNWCRKSCPYSPTNFWTDPGSLVRWRSKCQTNSYQSWWLWSRWFRLGKPCSWDQRFRSSSPESDRSDHGILKEIWTVAIWKVEIFGWSDIAWCHVYRVWVKQKLIES